MLVADMDSWKVVEDTAAALVETSRDVEGEAGELVNPGEIKVTF